MNDMRSKIQSLWKILWAKRYSIQIHQISSDRKGVTICFLSHCLPKDLIDKTIQANKNVIEEFLKGNGNKIDSDEIIKNT